MTSVYVMNTGGFFNERVYKVKAIILEKCSIPKHCFYRVRFGKAAIPPLTIPVNQCNAMTYQYHHYIIPHSPYMDYSFSRLLVNHYKYSSANVINVLCHSPLLII